MENAKYAGKRLLNTKEFLEYTGLGLTRGKAWAKEIGAFGKVGRRSVYDRAVIDDHIPELFKGSRKKA